MQNLLEEIKSSPGVLGSCVYTNHKGVLASNLPAVFKSATQNRIGQILNRVFKLNESVKLDVNSLEIQYDEALILVKRLCQSSSLVVFCEPDANIHLINMSTSVLAEDLQNLITDCEKTPLQEQPRPQSPQDVLNGSLAGELTDMKHALAKSIGPVAGKMLEKHLPTWLQHGPAERDRLKDLAHLLVTEIDDETDRKAFVAEMANII